jgi:hypothetical protein
MGMKLRHWTEASQNLGFGFALDFEITRGDVLKSKLEVKFNSFKKLFR